MMFSGFYTAASGMLMNQRRLNAVSNNMANQNTPGYQAKKVIGTTFDEELLRQQGGIETNIGGGSPIAIVAEEAIDFTQGNLKETNRPYDMAISGNGFFVIQGEGQEYLTRNGNFDRDNEGYLVLRGVGRVLGDDGPIKVDNGFLMWVLQAACFQRMDSFWACFGWKSLPIMMHWSRMTTGLIHPAVRQRESILQSAREGWRLRMSTWVKR